MMCWLMCWNKGFASERSCQEEDTEKETILRRHHFWGVVSIDLERRQREYVVDSASKQAKRGCDRVVDGSIGLSIHHRCLCWWQLAVDTVYSVLGVDMLCELMSLVRFCVFKNSIPTALLMMLNLVLYLQISRRTLDRSEDPLKRTRGIMEFY